jgi:hypothetical protein
MLRYCAPPRAMRRDSARRTRLWKAPQTCAFTQKPHSSTTLSSSTVCRGDCALRNSLAAGDSVRSSQGVFERVHGQGAGALRCRLFGDAAVVCLFLQ